MQPVHTAVKPLPAPEKNRRPMPEPANTAKIGIPPVETG